MKKKETYPVPAAKDELRKMAQIDVRNVDRDQVADLRDINIDESLPIADWLRSWIQQTGNPYIFKTGAYVVKMSR